MTHRFFCLAHSVRPGGEGFQHFNDSGARISRSMPGEKGCCAERSAADQLGGDPKDIRFTKPVRPRTGKIVPVCKDCQKDFDPSQFPPDTPFDE